MHTYSNCLFFVPKRHFTKQTMNTIKAHPMEGLLSLSLRVYSVNYFPELISFIQMLRYF